MSYIVKLENFEGPFDLLLQLTEKKHLDITELSLSKVTEDYLTYLEQLELGLEEMNWYLYVAARLVLNKSQAVLQLQTDEDETAIDDLTDSLKRYQQLKELAGQLGVAAKAPFFVALKHRSKNNNVAIELNQLTESLLSLQKDFQNRVQRITISNRSSAVAKIRTQFLRHINQLKVFSLQDTVGSAPDKTQAVIYFMTILDMLKEQKVAIRGSELEVAGGRAWNQPNLPS